MAELNINDTNELIEVKNNNGELFVSSREVSINFNKEHKNIKRDIRKLISSDLSVSNMFVKSEYKDVNNRTQEEFLMNRDGFSLLVMGFTGSKALEWKLKYIEAFNKMEEYIKNQVPQLSDRDNAILSVMNATSDIERVSALKQFEDVITKPLLTKIEEDKPLVDFSNTIAQNTDSIDMGTFAKLIKEEGIKMGRNKLFDWLRENKYLMKNNIPYQKFIDSKYFEIIEYSYNTPYGSKLGTKTLITGLGQIKIVEKLRKEFIN